MAYKAGDAIMHGPYRGLGGGSPCYLVFFVEKSPKMLRANEQKMMKYLVR
jgi:hypothetical protein